MPQNTQLALAYDIILLLVSVSAISGYFLISKVTKLSAEQRLLDHIIWVRSHNLYSYILDFQRELSIPQQYCLQGGQEELLAKKILLAFQNFIESAYFKKELLPIRSKYVVYGEQFFARMLWVYLQKHSCDGKISGCDMHEKQLSQHRYGESISSGFDATYSLTQFGIVYHKLYYISFRFLGNSPIFNKNGTLFQEPDSAFIKDAIDSAKISIRYMQQF